MITLEKQYSLLAEHLAPNFEECYSKLTTTEKRWITQLEDSIIWTYEKDTSFRKQGFGDLLDTLEAMNDVSTMNENYRLAVEWLINIWDEIKNNNQQEAKS